MKRIALVVNTLSSGGAERVAANLSRELSGSYDVDIVLNDSVNISYPYAGEIIAVGMPPDKDRSGSAYQIAALIRRTALLRRIKKKKKYAAVLSFSDNTNLSNILSGSKYGKTIISIRYSLTGKELSEGRKDFLRRAVLRICCRFADSVVCCSGEIRDQIDRAHYFSKDKLEVIYNGISKVQSIEKSGRERSLNNKSRIITIGRLSEQKAQWHLLFALRELTDRGLRAELIILGEGKLRQQLEKLSRALGVDGSVSMPGWIEHPESFMRSANVAAFTSTFEGFSNAIAECLSYGIPCVSTDHTTGARELLAPDTRPQDKISDHIEYARYGILVPVCSGGIDETISSGDDTGTCREASFEEKLLADALQEILTDTDLSERYRKAGEDRAKQLSWEAAAEQWAEIIER